MTEPITSFRDEYFFLSNMSPAIVNGFPTLEHAYVAAKIGPEHEAAVRSIESPYAVKRFGRKHPVVHDWIDRRTTVMRLLVEQKFSDSVLANKLLDTGDAEIIEGNTWGDTFWGQCPIGVGRNELGRILMETRYYMRFT